MSFPLAMDRPPSQGSTLTDTSTRDSLFSKLSGAESSVTELAQTSTEALAQASHSKDGKTDDFPDSFFSRVPDHVRELKHSPYTAAASC